MSESKKDWKKILTDEEYRVMREKGTEAPYIGKFDMHFDKEIGRAHV